MDRQQSASDDVLGPLLALPGVPDAVEAARSAIAAVQRHPANRRGWPRTTAAASVRAARASALLDGGRPEIDPDESTVTDPVLAGALRAATAIGRLAPIWQRAPLQALATLHTLAAAELPGPGGGSVETGRPASPAAADRLARLAALVTASRAPAPVQVAVVHAELLTSRPFGTADGVVARCAARLTLVSTGLDPKGLTVPESGYLRAGPAYPDLALGYRTGEAPAVAAWLIAHCDWLRTGAREASGIADAALDDA